MSLPRELLQKYDIVQELGRGGMGIVYLGIQKSINRKVAIKLIPPTIVDYDRLKDRFRREVDVLSRLSHPNIVSIIEFEQFSDGASCFVMEYVDGKSLSQILDHGRVTSWEQVVSWGLQIAAALNHAHDRGIIHRDIKPENVMQTSEGHIKVMDFGIARTAEGSNITQDHIIGTPSYMSPEQAKGQRIDTRSDIYSFGCLLYALLTGRPPFGADPNENPMTVIQQQISDKPVVISSLAPATPEKLVLLVHRLMAKAPDDRPQTAKEIIAELNRLSKASEGPMSSVLRFFRQLPGLPRRLSGGRLSIGDHCFLDLLLPGLSLVTRGKTVPGAVLFTISIVLFFLPFALSTSVSLRIITALFTFCHAQRIPFDMLIDHLWNSRRWSFIFTIIVSSGVMISVFAWESQSREDDYSATYKEESPPVRTVAMQDKPPMETTPPSEESVAPAELVEQPAESSSAASPPIEEADSTLASATTIEIEKTEEAPEREEQTEEVTDQESEPTSLSALQLPDLPQEVSFDVEKEEVEQTSVLDEIDSKSPVSIALVTAEEIRKENLTALREISDYLIAENEDAVEHLMLKTLLFFYLESRDRSTYLDRQGAVDWQSSEEKLRKLDAEAIDSPEVGAILTTIGPTLPKDSTSRLLRFHNFSRYINSGEEYTALTPFLLSEDAEVVYAALVLTSESQEFLEASDFSPILKRRFSPVELAQEIRKLTLDALEAKPDPAVASEIREALGRPSIVYGDHARMRRLLNQLEE